MSNTPRAGSGDGPGPWPFIVAVVLVFGPWAIILLTILAWDLDFIIAAARAVQIVIIVIIGGLGLAATIAAAIGAVGVWTRWASPRARSAATTIAVARSAWPELPDDARVTLTLGDRGSRATLEARPALEAPAPAALLDEPPPAVLPAPAPPVGQVLKALERQGLICRSGNSLLVGLDPAGVPVYIELADASIIALGGAPQTGKTSLALFLIAQAAMMGWPVYVCDPHGRHERGIISRGAPISGGFARQAIARHEIAETVAAFDALGAARINGDPDRTPAFLVIDEFPAQALAGDLTGVMGQLIRIGSQYPKVGLFIIAIGYEWNAQLFASPLSAPLRHLSRHRAVAQCDPGSAKFLVGERFAPQAAGLAPGEALFVGRGVFGAVRVPLIGHEDLRYAAGGTPPAPYVPLAELAEEPPALAAETGETVTLSLAGRILELLASSDAPLTSRAIIDALRADEKQAQTRLAELVEVGKLRRFGTRGAYRYTLTHTQGVPLEA